MKIIIIIFFWRYIQGQRQRGENGGAWGDGGLCGGRGGGVGGVGCRQD
jgi:hypothetical protein